MNWMDKLSRTDDCVTIKRCNFSRLFFADDLVLLTSSHPGLQNALKDIAAVMTLLKKKIRTTNIEVLHLSRNPVQCYLQIGVVSLKQIEKVKYRGVKLTRVGKQDE